MTRRSSRLLAAVPLQTRLRRADRTGDAPVLAKGNAAFGPALGEHGRLANLLLVTCCSQEASGQEL